MKRFISIIVLLLVVSLSYGAAPEGCWKLKFGWSKEQVKEAMDAKPVKSELTRETDSKLNYKGGTFENMEVKLGSVHFRDNGEMFMVEVFIAPGESLNEMVQDYKELVKKFNQIYSSVASKEGSNYTEWFFYDDNNDLAVTVQISVAQYGISIQYTQIAPSTPVETPIEQLIE